MNSGEDFSIYFSAFSSYRSGNKNHLVLMDSRTNFSGSENFYHKINAPICRQVFTIRLREMPLMKCLESNYSAINNENLIWALSIIDLPKEQIAKLVFPLSHYYFNSIQRRQLRLYFNTNNVFARDSVKTPANTMTTFEGKCSFVLNISAIRIWFFRIL